MPTMRVTGQSNGVRVLLWEHDFSSSHCACQYPNSQIVVEDT